MDPVAVLRQKLSQLSLAHIAPQDPKIQFVPHGRTSFILNAAPAYARRMVQVHGADAARKSCLTGKIKMLIIILYNGVLF